jgi:hypothetical protein
MQEDPRVEDLNIIAGPDSARTIAGPNQESRKIQGWRGDGRRTQSNALGTTRSTLLAS